MSAGTAYSKRYAGGFADRPATTSPIDSTFLNAVEAALLQLQGVAATVDGQVMQWDFANTRYGPALLLNKNIDAAAAISKSKIDLTGASGIVNADVGGAAAIARSKLDFGSGLVNADIAAAAAIAASKLSGIGSNSNAVSISGANTDLALVSAASLATYFQITTGGGSLRNLGVPTFPGSVVTFLNTSASNVTIKHNTAGTSAYLYMPLLADLILAPGASVSFMFNGGVGGNYWVQMGSVGPTWLKKNSAKVVVNTVAATDLFNGEFTLPILSPTSIVRVRAWGDWVQNTGANNNLPRFAVVLGGVTLVDTAVPATAQATNATRMNWGLDFTIENLNATGSQSVDISGHVGYMPLAAGAADANFNAGTGSYAQIAAMANGTSGMALIKGGVTGAAANTAVAAALALNVINGVASVNCDCRLFGALAEIF